MEDAAHLTFEATDKLGLKRFSGKLERFLSVEHDFVDGSLVVSLNAPFGAGKTTSLSVWKSDLDKRLPSLNVCETSLNPANWRRIQLSNPGSASIPAARQGRD